jgi:hypothetical protein
MRASRAASPFHQTSDVMADKARGELLLLGTCVMNGFVVGSKFSLQALRAGLRTDNHPPPKLRHCWYLRSRDRRPAGIFMPTNEALEVVGSELGLMAHECPSNSQWCVLVRLGVVVNWPDSAQEVRRARQR